MIMSSHANPVDHDPCRVLFGTALSCVYYTHFLAASIFTDVVSYRFRLTYLIERGTCGGVPAMTTVRSSTLVFRYIEKMRCLKIIYVLQAYLGLETFGYAFLSGPNLPISGFICVIAYLFLTMIGFGTVYGVSYRLFIRHNNTLPRD